MISSIRHRPLPRLSLKIFRTVVEFSIQGWLVCGLIRNAYDSKRVSGPAENRRLQEISSRLNDYYLEQGIHSLNFNCRNRKDCSANCGNFTEAKASLVGPLYGDPLRVLVVSLDPGKGTPNPQDRTLEASVARDSASNPDKFPKHRHWYRTFETVAAIFSHLTEQEFAPRDMSGRFAHINSAKCSHNLPGNKQAPKRLFENCRPYLAGEIAILAPDIIITQGKRAAQVLEPWTKKSRWKNVVEIEGHSAYWLKLVHPTAWGGAYGRDQKTWPRRLEHTRRWLEAHSRQLIRTAETSSNGQKEKSALACPLCEPPASRVFLERKHIRIIWDGYPISPGHALIVPKRHFATWDDASQPERRALMRAISLAQSVIRENHTPDGFNIGINDGPAAGQTIPHLHVHVIPRYSGDVKDPRGGVRWVIPQRADYWSQPDR